MENKKNWLGILAIVLMSGMTIIGCNKSVSSGTFTITGIPSKYDNKFVILFGNTDTFILFGGEKIIDWNEGRYRGFRISDGKVVLPLWIVKDSDGGIERYFGNHVIGTLTAYVFESSNIVESENGLVDDNYIDGIFWGYTERGMMSTNCFNFNNGNATCEWNSASPIDNMMGFLEINNIKELFRTRSRYKF